MIKTNILTLILLVINFTNIDLNATDNSQKTKYNEVSILANHSENDLKKEEKKAKVKSKIKQIKKDKSNFQIKELRSNRGIRFFYMKYDDVPLVNIQIVFKNSGAAYQKKSKEGVPSFYSGTIFYGCGKYSSAEFDKIMNDSVIAMHCSSDADTLNIRCVAPTLVIDNAVSLLNSALTDPKFEEDKVKIFQNSMINILTASSTGANKRLISVIFKNHPYENGSYGSPEDYAKLSIDDLKKYKDEFIVATNAEACVFGNISENEAKKLIDRIFDKVNQGQKSEDTIKDIQPILSSVQKKYYEQGPQSTVVFALKGANLHSADRFPARVFTAVFGEGSIFKGRLIGILRGKGYIYAGNIATYHLNHSDYVFGIFKTDNKKVDEAISILKDIIRDFRENGISESELNFAKNLIKGSLLVNLRTSGKLCDFYFEALKKGLGVDALDNMLNGIDTVTLDDVRNFCRNNLNENEIPFVILGGNTQ